MNQQESSLSGWRQKGFWLTPREELNGLSMEGWLGEKGFGSKGELVRYQWFSNNELAKELGTLLNIAVNADQIKGHGHRRRWNKAPECLKRLHQERATFLRKGKLSTPKPPRSTRYNQPLKLQGDVAVASCWHVPFWSKETAEHLMEIAQGFGIKQLLIPGDFLNMAAFAKYFPSTKEVTTKQEFTAAKELLEWLLRWFEAIYICRGNHEDRLWTKTLEREIPFEDIGDFCGGTFVGRVKWTPYSYALVKSGSETWRVTHPGSYSRIPTRVAQTLAAKFEQHIVSAHGHLMGWSPSLSGKYNTVDSGGMFDPEKIDYVGLSDTTHPAWTQGFVIVFRGKPYIFNPLLIDFDIWRKFLSGLQDKQQSTTP